MRSSSLITIILTSVILVPTTVLAVSQDINFDPSQNSTGLTSVTKLTFLSTKLDPASITFSLINTALGMLGFISMLMIIYGGVLWFRSGENEEQLTQAKGLIKGAVIGLILTLSALSVSVLLFYSVQEVTFKGQPGSTTPEESQ